ncbi:MAG TPA: LytTR family DNA-binding domain-containing protein [Candidatus Acidoferrum sp.]|nr:LytTR family DNA-binding domain-containing protein [Candidatus Acidoferrum sp.]
MSDRKIQDQRAIRREMFARHVVQANADLSARPLPADTISIAKSRRHSLLASPAPGGLHDPADSSPLSATRVDSATIIRALRDLEIIASRQAPRIAFKANGRILFLYLAEIVAVRSQGNYVSLLHHPQPHLLRESLSSMAEKLKPYGFIRIHRSVVVNISAVEEIQPLPTGEYGLRVKGGEKYLVTRTYKKNLRELAQLWVGSERLCG